MGGVLVQRCMYVVLVMDVSSALQKGGGGYVACAMPLVSGKARL